MILICEHRIATVTFLTLATVIFSTWLHAIWVNIWYCTRYLPDTWHVILDTSRPTLIVDMLYLMHDLWHQHLIYYIWYLIHDTRYLHRHLICYTWHLILTPGIWHALCGTSTLTWHRDPWPDTTTHDTVLYGIFMTITFTGTWHDYYIITRHLVLLNSCILEPL